MSPGLSTSNSGDLSIMLELYCLTIAIHNSQNEAQLCRSTDLGKLTDQAAAFVY